MTQPAAGSGEGGIAGRLGSAWRGDGREPGSRRAKLRGLVSSVKDAYQQNYAGVGSSFKELEDYDGGKSEAYPDGTVARSGNEEMTLFPSYARHHIMKQKGGEQDPNATEESANPSGSNAQAVQQHWDKYEDKDAIVDVDVRGWVYSPHRGPMNRKQRLAIGIARQLAGLPYQSSTGSPSSNSPQSSRATSPHPLREKIEEHSNKKEQRLIDLETQSILSKTESEAERANRGEYSEFGPRDNHERPDGRRKFAATKSAEDSDEPKITMLQKRASWNQPADMTGEELSTAHNNLMTRLRPFYANPLENAPVSAFFYNDKDSRQRTIYTNNYGHFALRAALDFIPTHVRVLASEHLSATTEVKIENSSGISVISDIDDTIKHTAMISGAREAFRNAFLRDLNDLVIDGVQEWFHRLADMGVGFHYVSNSPWQLFPVLSRFFLSVRLPTGSFHLKQYSGMLQGIFEPVAERKKSTLDRIARDFPERYFILVGDSGEADLEVYVDFVQDNPGRVLGVFIRDVTTPVSHGFFDSNSNVNVVRGSSGFTTPRDVSQQMSSSAQQEADPELKAAIDASLKEFEAEEARRKGSATTHTSRPLPAHRRSTSGDLISFSDDDDEKTTREEPGRNSTPDARKINAAGKRVPPPRPQKPEALRAPSSRSLDRSLEKRNSEMPPRIPARQSTTPSQATPSSRDSFASDNGAEASYKAAAKQKLAYVYNTLPSAPWTSSEPQDKQDSSSETRRSTSTLYEESQRNSAGRDAPSPALPRRGISSYPVAAAQYASTRVNNAISYYSGSAQSPNAASPGGAAAAAGLTGAPPTAANPAMTKSQTNRIELWKRRWAQAEQTLSKKGVVLKSWRVGTDAMDASVKLVEKVERKIKDEHNKRGKGDGVGP
jgi:phosphatidate phosphatase APP1